MTANAITSVPQVLAASTNSGDVAYTSRASGTRAVYRPSDSVGSSGQAPEPQTPDSLNDRVLSWLASNQARTYDGKWVLLGSDMTVVAHGDSPNELPASPEGVVVFVLPANIGISG